MVCINSSKMCVCVYYLHCTDLRAYNVGTLERWQVLNKIQNLEIHTLSLDSNQLETFGDKTEFVCQSCKPTPDRRSQEEKKLPFSNIRRVPHKQNKLIT